MGGVSKFLRLLSRIRDDECKMGEACGTRRSEGKRIQYFWWENLNEGERYENLRVEKMLTLKWT